MPFQFIFKKTGHEVKEAINNKLDALQSRLDKRNLMLDELLDDRQRLRSYLVRSAEKTNFSGRGGGHTSQTLIDKQDVSSEEVEEIDQMLRRIHQIEQEIRRLRLIAHHIPQDEIHELNYNDLITYGFDLLEDISSNSNSQM